MVVSEQNLQTIEQYGLLCDLLDSNGIVDDSVLEKLRLGVRALLESTNYEPSLVDLSQQVLFHDNMKSFGLHQLILLYIEWQKDKLDAIKNDLETEAEV